MRAKRLATLLICLALPAVAGAGFTDAGIDGEVKALTIYEGNLIAGGEFTTAGGVTANGIARWSGGAWQPLGRGLEGVQMYWDTRGDTIYFQPYVADLTVFRGDLIAGGSFTQAGGVPAVSIARWDGAAWYPLGVGIHEDVEVWITGDFFYFPPNVQTLTVHGDTLHVGGLFEEAGGIAARTVASWDGISWHALGIGLGGNPPSRAMASVVYDTDLIVGGNFTHAGIWPAPSLAEWDDVKWGGLSDGFAPPLPDTQVQCVTIFQGNLIAGGHFSTAGGNPASNVAAWNGSSWSGLDAGLSNDVHALAVFENQLYAGAFRWGGESWANALQTDGPVKTMVVYQGNLIVGGIFSLIDGRPCQNIASWPDDLTPAYLVAFNAARRGRTALLEWEIAYLHVDAAFSVWRQLPGQEMVSVAGEVEGEAELAFRFVDPEAPDSAVDYWLQEMTTDGEVAWFGPAHLQKWVPGRLDLAQNRPNPFNPQTTFSFTLPLAGTVHLTVYDARGRTVAVLVDAVLSAGEYTARWDGRDTTGLAAASGVYVVRLEAEGGAESRKITLAR